MGEQLELFPNENPVKDDKKYVKQAEWCFQFFDNEPVPFAYSNEENSKDPLILEILPVEGEALTFSFNGMRFRVFAREMSKETKELIKNEG